MSKVKKPTRKVAGAVQFIERSVADKFGYVADFQEHPILVYTETGDIEEPLYGKVEEGFTIESRFFKVPDHLIERILSIEEAREVYPELFL